MLGLTDGAAVGDARRLPVPGLAIALFAGDVFVPPSPVPAQSRPSPAPRDMIPVAAVANP